MSSRKYTVDVLDYVNGYIQSRFDGEGLSDELNLRVSALIDELDELIEECEDEINASETDKGDDT